MREKKMPSGTFCINDKDLMYGRRFSHIVHFQLMSSRFMEVIFYILMIVTVSHTQHYHVYLTFKSSCMMFTVTFFMSTEPTVGG